MKSDREIIQLICERRKDARSALGEQYASFEKCLDAYNGDMNKRYGDVSVMDRTGGTKTITVSFNKIKPYINAVKGFFAQNRRKPQYTARTSATDEQKMFSDYANGLYRSVTDNCNADQIETMCDGDMLIYGIGAVETNLVYGDGYASRNPNGEIEMMRLDPMNMWWDAASRQPNLIDARYVAFERDYHVDEAKQLFAAGEDDFDEKEGSQTGEPIYGSGGGFYSDLKEVYDFSDFDKKMVKVTFYQWFEIEKFYRFENPLASISDPIIAQIVSARLAAIHEEYSDDDLFIDMDATKGVLSCNSDIKSRLVKELEGIEIDFDTLNRRVYYYAVVSGKKLFKKGKSISQSGFTTKVKTGDWNGSKRIWCGLVYSMIEPMKYYNKALTELMFSIASSAKGGVMYEEDAIHDVAEFESSYARTDTATKVAIGALSQGKIKPKREPWAPNGVEELIQISDGSINDVVGIDKGFLGAIDNGNETAMLQKQRIKQMLSVLACYSDSITLYQKEHARLMLDLLYAYLENNEGDTFRVEDNETGEVSYSVLSIANWFGNYDVTIAEGATNEEDKQQQAQMLSSIGDSLIQVDPASAKTMYALSLKFLPLDQSDKMLIQKTLIPDQEQIDPQQHAMLMQQVEQLSSELQQAQTKLLLSQAAKSMASVEETHAKIRNLNMDTIKKRTEAQKNVAQASDIANMPSGNLPQPQQGM